MCADRAPFVAQCAPDVAERYAVCAHSAADHADWSTTRTVSSPDFAERAALLAERAPMLAERAALLAECAAMLAERSSNVTEQGSRLCGLGRDRCALRPR